MIFNIIGKDNIDEDEDDFTGVAPVDRYDDFSVFGKYFGIMPIGLLTDISNEFHMMEAQAGVMITAYSWTVTLLSLPLMLLVCRIQPKKCCLER